MKISRVSEDHQKYIRFNESIEHSTAFIAVEEGKVMASFEYRFISFDSIEIINFSIFEKCDNNKIFEDFIDEVNYWNPFIREVICKRNLIGKDILESRNFIKDEVWKLKIKGKVTAFKIQIKDIIPEQLTVEENKYLSTLKWIKKPEDVVVCCVNIDGKIVSIDGHSRLVAALNKGFEYVYGFIDPDSDDLDFFKVCLSWCKEAGIFSINDLSKRIVSSKEHKSLWTDRCQNYLRMRE